MDAKPDVNDKRIVLHELNDDVESWPTFVILKRLTVFPLIKASPHWFFAHFAFGGRANYI